MDCRRVSVRSSKITREELKPGDHIYSWRDAYLYNHHGIFVVGDEVIHFTSAAGHEIGTRIILNFNLSISSPASWSAPRTCLRCKQLTPFQSHNNSSGVISSCLDCFLDSCDLCHYAYSKSLFFVAMSRINTCITADSNPPNVVLNRARYLLTHGFGAYSLLENNCIHFAIYCKTGRLPKSLAQLSWELMQN